IAKLLHPFMPFLTEELWDGRGGEGLLMLAAWPHLHGLADADAEAEIGWVVDLVSEIRSARSETNVPAGAQIPLVLVNASPQVRARLAHWEETIKRLARLSEIGVAANAPPKAVQLIVRGEVAALPLEGIVDLAAEQGRLQKELSKVDADIAKIEAKLGNADFLRRAPEEVVEEQRERKEEAEARKRKIDEALLRLRAAA
ncbi:MAG TPA: class I tRNA ligase family protein, partial [Beijerinckiaceae bacterium]|nr:class I tRNA ligase family protein [Beijerinckiaceae bacterium]